MLFLINQMTKHTKISLNLHKVERRKKIHMKHDVEHVTFSFFFLHNFHQSAISITGSRISEHRFQNLCEFWNTNAKTSYTIILDSII
jgi:hypothetical protein